MSQPLAGLLSELVNHSRKCLCRLGVEINVCCLFSSSRPLLLYLPHKIEFENVL